MIMLRKSLVLLAVGRLPAASISAFAKPVPFCNPRALAHFSTSTAVHSTKTKQEEDQATSTRTIPVQADGDDKTEMVKKTEATGQNTTALSPWGAIDYVFSRDPFFSPGPSLMRPFFRDDFFARPFFGNDFMMPTFMPVLKPVESLLGSKILRSSPGYEIKEDDETYQFAIQVPEGVRNASDVTVNLESSPDNPDNKFLHVSGERKEETDTGFTETRFDQRFSIGPDIMDTEQLTANLHDGILVVKAPKLKQIESEATVKKIDVTENTHTDDAKK
jgi:HSP20 family molecular chaperone IbpA